MALSELTEYVHIYNTSKCPQHYGHILVPAHGYAAAPKIMVDAMLQGGVSLIKEDNTAFVPLFKRSQGNGVIA